MIAPARDALRRAVAPRVDELALRRYRTLSARRRRDRRLDRATLRALEHMVEQATERPAPVPRARPHRRRAPFRALAEADLSGDRPSAPVRRALVEQFHRLYYHSHERTWQDTRFLGVNVWKTPLDLWLYQELIHDLRPDVLIEAGTKFGGSAYYFARMFDLIDHGEVVTIDVEEQPDRPEHPRITYLSGSLDRPGRLRPGRRAAGRRQAADRARLLTPPRARARRAAALEPARAGRLLHRGRGHPRGRPPVTTRIGRGPWAAVKDFLRETDDFEVDESMHKFFLTFNPRGYLKRVR